MCPVDFAFAAGSLLSVHRKQVECDKYVVGLTSNMKTLAKAR